MNLKTPDFEDELRDMDSLKTVELHCEECGEHLYTSQTARRRTSYGLAVERITTEIEGEIKQHIRDTGHTSYAIDVTTWEKPTVDVEITVND